MKNLILIRHAKSSWDAPLNDKERSLEQKGIKDALLVAKGSIGFIPAVFQIYSSSARRASETAILFAQVYSYSLDAILFLDELYTFDEYILEKRVRSIPNHYDNIILFGHNEAITNFVNKFADIFIDNVPTAGFVSIQFDAEAWQNIRNGKILKVIFPKDLK